MTDKPKAPEAIDWADDSWESAKLNISKAPDMDRIRAAWSDAVSYEANADKDWFSHHDAMLLWQRADDIYAEEFGLPKRSTPWGGITSRIVFHATVAEMERREEEEAIAAGPYG